MLQGVVALCTRSASWLLGFKLCWLFSTFRVILSILAQKFPTFYFCIWANLLKLQVNRSLKQSLGFDLLKNKSWIENYHSHILTYFYSIFQVFAQGQCETEAKDEIIIESTRSAIGASEVFLVFERKYRNKWN